MPHQQSGFFLFLDEISIKYVIFIFAKLPKFYELNKFVRAINLITKIKLRSFILFIVNIIFIKKKRRFDPHYLLNYNSKFKLRLK